MTMFPKTLLATGAALLLCTGHSAAITGSWYFTGCRFEGRVSNPQVTRTDGTVVITQAPSGSYTLNIQTATSPATITVPLVKSGSDYRAEFELSIAPYDIVRSVVIRDHGGDTLTLNWADAGYEQESPYGGVPDMQKFSALSGALTKTAAPAADANAWEGLHRYNGHLFEADDAFDTLQEDFAEDVQVTRTSTNSFIGTDVGDGDQTPLTLTNGELRWESSSSLVTTEYESPFFLVESFSEMENLRTIQLGNGRAVLLWFGQALHRLTIKATDTSNAEGPYPSVQFASAEVGLLTKATVPVGPPADATTDTDADGVSDLLEYAFNLNPAVADRRVLAEGSGTAGLPAIRRSTPTSGPLRIEYLRRKNAAGLGIAYTVQWSSDLGNWATGGTPQVTSIDDQWERVVVNDPAPGPKRFGRVTVTRLATP